MKKIWYKSTLFEYDGPQIFEARDRIGGHYIAVAVEESGTDCQYLVVGTEVENLRRFRIGEIDLLSLLVESSRDEWYLTSSNMNEEQSVTIQPQQGSLLERDYLPDPGLILYDSITTNSLVSEARARDNLIVEIVTEPPESETGHRIRVNTLSGLLNHFQSLVYQACRDQFEHNSSRHQKEKIKELAQMDVVIPAAAGSFRMLLESSKPKDLLGFNTGLASALDIVDDLFASVASVQQQQLYSPIRPRSLHRFFKLLEFLDSNNTNLNYSWAEPNFEIPKFSSVSTNQIRSYIATKKELPEPTIEEVTLVGEIERVNRKRKTWGLYTTDGNILTGVVGEDGQSLNGLTVGKYYEFICTTEISEQEDAQTKYVMKNYKPL